MLVPICVQPICIILLLWHNYYVPLQQWRNWCQPPLPTVRRSSNSNGDAPVLDSCHQPSICLHFPAPIGPPNRSRLSILTHQSIFNQNTKWCETYLPPQDIFEPTHLAKPYETVPSFLNIWPATPNPFRTDTPSQSLLDSPIIPQQIICPSKPFLNRNAKPSPVIQSRHSSS